MYMPSIFGSFNDLMDLALPDFKKGTKDGGTCSLMRTDVIEHDGSYEMRVDLPGFKKDEISLTLKDGAITIEVSKDSDDKESDKADGKYLRRERCSCSMTRSFSAWDGLKAEDIKARYEDGVLTVVMPKETEQPDKDACRIAIG